MRRSDIKRQFERTLKLSNKVECERHKLNLMCSEYYGEETYSDHDKDEIIDTLDYGHGYMEFDVFDKIMKEVNAKS